MMKNMYMCGIVGMHIVRAKNIATLYKRDSLLKKVQHKMSFMLSYTIDLQKEILE